jgi:hypothetical protein
MHINWPAVYDTFAPHESAIDVVPFHTKFGGLNGIRDFYQAVDAAFPDFKATVWGEYDTPGCSIREITVEGTHKGEWCGVAATGRRVKVHFLSRQTESGALSNGCGAGGKRKTFLVYRHQQIFRGSRCDCG